MWRFVVFANHGAMHRIMGQLLHGLTRYRLM